MTHQERGVDSAFCSFQEEVETMLQAATIFQDHMILQRKKQIHVWGQADKEESIEVLIQGKSCRTIADEHGAWMAEIPPLTASESETLVIKGEKEVLTIEDVAVGEVWVAAGQSNMEFPMKYEKHFREEKPGEKAVDLRFYDQAEVCYEGQDQDFDYSAVNVWRKATREDLEYFSAVGYFFQKEIRESLSVPVGIIGCNWGGTRSSSWMKEETVKRVGPQWMDLYQQEIKGLDMKAYWEMQRQNPANDKGNLNEDPFCEFFLPRTPGKEEIEEYNRKIPEEMKKYADLVPPQMKPGCLYEHMVKKIAPYGIQGVLWYQGESDDAPGLQHLYETMLTALIQDWRTVFREESLPFFLVQLPGWSTWLEFENHEFSIIRSCQEQTAKNVKNVFLCSISDAGEELDIHPKNKKVVGERLALLALGHVYEKDILCDAPALEKMERKDREIVLSFRHAGEGLKVEGEQPEALYVEDQEKRLPFRFRIKGDQLILSLDQSPSGPVTVAFAQEKWYQVNLYNSAGIPAIPFLRKG